MTSSTSFPKYKYIKLAPLFGATTPLKRVTLIIFLIYIYILRVTRNYFYNILFVFIKSDTCHHFSDADITH
jgi:hypothetical protein